MPFFTPIGIKRNRWNETNLAVVVMRKDRELQAEEDHITWQTTIKTKWALRSDYVFFETRVVLYLTWCILSRYSKFSKIKNSNRMMNINDNAVASLELWTRMPGILDSDRPIWFTALLVIFLQYKYILMS